MSDTAEESPDRDREEMAMQADPGPDRSRTYRLFRWLTENILLLAGVIGLGLLVVSSFLGVTIPRNLKIIGTSSLVSLVLVGRPVGKKAASWLYDPNFIWLLDVDARVKKAGIFRVPAQRFREWSVGDGNLDWVSADLAFGKNVDLEEQSVDGTWRGTLTDRELMRSLQAVEECRGQLEDDAKAGFAIESQAFTIVRNATRKAVLTVVNTFEQGTLPDDGSGITDEIDSAVEQFGLERKIRNVESDDSPESDVPGVSVNIGDVAESAVDDAVADAAQEVTGDD